MRINLVSSVLWTAGAWELLIGLSWGTIAEGLAKKPSRIGNRIPGYCDASKKLVMLQTLTKNGSTTVLHQRAGPSFEPRVEVCRIVLGAGGSAV
jgi:hypothetical protein